MNKFCIWSLNRVENLNSQSHWTMQQNATAVTRITSIKPWNYSECISTDKSRRVNIDVNCTNTPSAISDSYTKPIELHIANCISQQMVSSHPRHHEPSSLGEFSTLQFGELLHVLAPSGGNLERWKFHLTGISIDCVEFFRIAMCLKNKKTKIIKHNKNGKRISQV